ncbi:DedA family protein [Streptomyces acidiscabies]|uniref:DedA family protein n=1 Tax=Streptomyces acidiscabies TaxID=42234 RepID=A0AAP6BEI8_9ACTN|nr:DedA family protein [Streptomyces acidiscabies]MDX2963234.1 DedA family protein [Streptomyces acidiscabies]MDX3024315.1 DedA family protein [Streptomyces acidiscabies]MDX3795287.1 DedA family protein [Streptomyces acidiscabies]GAV39721.1 inner membrane protein YghB [Streptomyces acidiscabies]
MNLDLAPSLAYPLLALAVLAESVLVIGAFVPTLTLMLTAGALSRTGHLSLPVVIAVAAGAVVTGDFLAHRTGRFLGPRMSNVPQTARRRAESLMTRFGGRAVLLCRFLPVLRTITPYLAGATGLPYRRIAPYSAVAACVWAGAEAGVGYAAAESLVRLLTLGGPALALVVLTVLGVTLVWRRRRTASSC